TYTISANTNNVNLFTLASSPGSAGNYQFTINAGVTIGSTNTSNPAVDTGTWPAGTKLWIVNNGTIIGKGGNGGDGGDYVASSINGGTAGSAGGPALTLRNP